METSHLSSLAPDEPAAQGCDLPDSRMLLPPSIHKSKGVLHKLKTLDIASPAPPRCIGRDIKVRANTVEVATQEDVAVMRYDWQ